MISTIKQQTRDLATELNRVDWPSKDAVLKSAWAVTVVSVFVGVYLWAADWVISWAMQFLLPRH